MAVGIEESMRLGVEESPVSLRVLELLGSLMDVEISVTDGLVEVEDVMKDETSIVFVDVEKVTGDDVEEKELSIRDDVEEEELSIEADADAGVLATEAGAGGVDKAGGSTPFFPFGPSGGSRGASEPRLI